MEEMLPGSEVLDFDYFGIFQNVKQKSTGRQINTITNVQPVNHQSHLWTRQSSIGGWCRKVSGRGYPEVGV